jgi:hypothetical protein
LAALIAGHLWQILLTGVDDGWAQMVISYLLGPFDSWAPMGNVVNLVRIMAGHQMIKNFFN